MGGRLMAEDGRLMGLGSLMAPVRVRGLRESAACSLCQEAP